QEYRERRDLMYEGLKAIPGITVAKPEGAFYIMAGLPVKDSEKFCVWLLETYRNNNETVMLAPGNGFYATPEKGIHEVRIAYVLQKEKLKRSLKLLADALKRYSD